MKKETEPEVKIIYPDDRRRRERDTALRSIEEIARFLDSRFTIPGTRIRFGLDPILGLFPVIGDLVTFFISGALIYTMYNHGASRKVVIKMMLNATLDAVVGSIPLAGPVFDIFYRANDRNVHLLKEHYFEGKHQGSGNTLLVILGIVCLLIVAAAIYGIYRLFEWIF